MAIPLFFVIGISMIKDAFEDYKRHLSDSQENDKLVLCLDRHTGRFEDKNWHKIIVGDILKIKSDQYIPADLLILHSSDPKGCCYVETKNLDGETNLKIKNA
jgi:P-type E1-E2 ATPase